VGVIEESMAAWEGSTLSLTAILQASIKEWEASTTRREMREGVAYYKGKNAICDRLMYVYDAAGNKSVDADAANNRIPHGFMRLAIDEKVAYIVGKSPTYTSEALPKLEEALQAILTSHFSDKLSDWVGVGGKCGISWLHPYIVTGSDSKPVLRFALIPSDQVIPLWNDEEHEVLQGVIRTFNLTEYQGDKRVEVRHVELWTPETVMYYVESEGLLIPDIAAEETGEPRPHIKQGSKAYAWEVVPFAPLKNNSDEQPDHVAVKGIIDAYDLIVSDTANTLEDIARLVLILTNYDGEDLADFRRNLKTHKAIKVGDNGAVSALKAEMDPTATEKMLDRLAGDFYRFAQSVDMTAQDGSADPSGVALEFIYSGLKLKCDTVERKLQNAFERIFAIVCRFIEITGGGKFDPALASVTFTRSAIRNEKDALESVNLALGSHSEETALAHSPWVTDPAGEIAKRAEEQPSLTGA